MPNPIVMIIENIENEDKSREDLRVDIVGNYIGAVMKHLRTHPDATLADAMAEMRNVLLTMAKADPDKGEDFYAAVNRALDGFEDDVHKVIGQARDMIALVDRNA